MSKSRKEEAQDRTSALKDLDKGSKASWWAQGEHIWHVHEKALWKELEFESQKAWLEATLPMSRQTAHDAMKCWAELHKLEGYTEIPKENAKILYKDVPQSRRKRYLKAAKTLPTRQFRAFVADGKVGAAKAEETVQKHFIFTLKQWEQIQRGLDFMLAEEAVTSIEEGLEYMAVEFMQDPARADRAMEMEQDADAAAESEQPEN